MLAFISRLVVQLAAVRWLFKLGGLALLLPIAAILKVVGIPLMLILMVVGAPVIALLFLFGLPIFAALLVGGLIVGLLGFVLMIGVAALKFAIFIVLPIWLVVKLVSWMFKRGGDAPPATTTEASEPVDPIDLGTPPV